SRFYSVAPSVRRDEYFRFAVVDDVFHFLPLQSPADRCVVESRALRRPADLEELRMIFEQDCDVVAAPEPKRPEELRTAVRCVLELLPRDLDSTARQHVCRSMWRPFGMYSRMHARLPAP